MVQSYILHRRKGRQTVHSGAGFIARKSTFGILIGPIAGFILFLISGKGQRDPGFIFRDGCIGTQVSRPYPPRGRYKPQSGKYQKETELLQQCNNKACALIHDLKDL